MTVSRTEGKAIPINTVSVRLAPGGRGVPAEWYERVLAKFLLRSGFRGAEVSLLVAGDAAIRRLNRRYRGKDRATNCLSFPQGQRTDLSSGGPTRRRIGTGWLLGDVVVSLPTARREARELDCGVRDRLRFLMAHSLAHLAGHDHRTLRQERAMRRMERKLMSGGRR